MEAALYMTTYKFYTVTKHTKYLSTHNGERIAKHKLLSQNERIRIDYRAIFICFLFRMYNETSLLYHIVGHSNLAVKAIRKQQ